MRCSSGCTGSPSGSPRPSSASSSGPSSRSSVALHDRRGRLGARHRCRDALDGHGRRRPPGLRGDGDGPRRQLHAPGATSSGRSASRSRAWRSGSPRTARSSPAARVVSPATGRTRRRHGRGHRPGGLVPHRRPRRVHQGRDAHVPRPEEGHARTAGRPEGLRRGRRGDPQEDDRVKDAAIVGWPLGAGLRSTRSCCSTTPPPRTGRRGRQRAACAAPADPRLDRLAQPRPATDTRSRSASRTSSRASRTSSGRPPPPGGRVQAPGRSTRPRIDPSRSSSRASPGSKRRPSR